MSKPLLHSSHFCTMLSRFLREMLASSFAIAEVVPSMSDHHTTRRPSQNISITMRPGKWSLRRYVGNFVSFSRVVVRRYWEGLGGCQQKCTNRVSRIVTLPMSQMAMLVGNWQFFLTDCIYDFVPWTKLAMEGSPCGKYTVKMGRNKLMETYHSKS